MTKAYTALAATRAAMRKVTCPKCGAAPGDPCKGAAGYATQVPHFARREAAYTAGHLPLKDGATDG